MTLNISKLAVLAPVLLMNGNPREDEVSPKVTVAQGTSCAEADLLPAVESSLLEKTGAVEFVVAAGPNRLSSLPVTIRLVNRVAEESHGKVALVLRVDEQELSADLKTSGRMDQTDPRWASVVSEIKYDASGPSVAELLGTVHADVQQIVAVQPMGTSYTEVANSMAETEAKRLVFLAHNWPLQERLTLAALNTVSAGTVGADLSGVQILCHGNTLDADFAKEALSYTLDGSTSFVGGHDLVMDTSKGGHRQARLKEKLGL